MNINGRGFLNSTHKIVIVVSLNVIKYVLIVRLISHSSFDLKGKLVMRDEVIKFLYTSQNVRYGIERTLKYRVFQYTWDPCDCYSLYW